MPLKPENEKFKIPERPLECTECKKNIAVRYTEIVGKSIVHTSMCADCPELQRRLHGSKHFEESFSTLRETGVVCGNCGTTLQAILVGTPLGCSQCYEVFADTIISELISEEKIPARALTSKKVITLHVGRNPGEIPEISPSTRLLALNEALSETLKLEDYEQAAWLRDQIKALTEKSDKGDT